jgi:hypothetical protein
VTPLPAATALPKKPLSRAEMETRLLLPATRESASDLLQKARLWCSRLENPAPIRNTPPVAQNIKNTPIKTRSHDNVKLEVASLRSDIESVRREIKHLGKRVSKKKVQIVFFYSGEKSYNLFLL